MHQYDDWFRAFLDAGDAVLEFEDVFAQGGGTACGVEVSGGGTEGCALSCGLDV